MENNDQNKPTPSELLKRVPESSRDEHKSLESSLKEGIDEPQTLEALGKMRAEIGNSANGKRTIPINNIFPKAEWVKREELPPEVQEICEELINPDLANAINIIESAKNIIKDRAENYPDMQSLFACVAEDWALYIKMKYGIKVPLQASDAPRLMSRFKEIRAIKGTYNIDNDVDHIGYIAIANNLQQQELNNA